MAKTAFCWILFTALVRAQGLEAPSPPAGTGEHIEDNSFFIEEAFNQDDRVVQHISSLTLFHSPVENILYTFTQEWPVGGRTNQLSYTLPLQSLDSRGGIGDIAVHYRYQLSTIEGPAAVAPDLTVTIPTGSAADGTGTGSVGIQLTIPASRYLSKEFIAHLNAGAAWIPSAKAELAQGEVSRSLGSYSGGGSLIWLASPVFNVMLECVATRSASIGDDGGIVWSNQLIVSPGIRYAINAGSLQIVPGLAAPLVISSLPTTGGGYFYLSFEHPF